MSIFIIAPIKRPQHGSFKVTITNKEPKVPTPDSTRLPMPVRAPLQAIERVLGYDTEEGDTLKETDLPIEIEVDRRQYQNGLLRLT